MGWGLALVLLLFPKSALADYLEVRRPATLKVAPDRDAEISSRSANG